MRVLHVLQHALPLRSEYAARTEQIVQRQQALGLEVACVTSALQPEGARPARFNQIAYTHARRPAGSLQVGLLEVRLMRALGSAVAAAIDRHRPHLVHAHAPALVGMPALVEARRHGLPFVYEVRARIDPAGEAQLRTVQHRMVRRLEALVLRRADAVVAVNNAMADDLGPRLGPDTSLHVVADGVDLERFRPRDPDPAVRARWNLHEKRVLAYVGRMDPRDGLETLIDATGALLRMVPDAHVVISGGDSDELVARAVARRLNADVTFTGRVPNDHVAGLCSVADLMVYPRHLTRISEGTPPEPLRAMAMGRPLLVSDAPGLRELVIPGRTGAIFAAGTPADLATRAAEVLAEPGRAAAMGEAARAWVEAERSWPDLVERYLGIYESVRHR